MVIICGLCGLHNPAQSRHCSHCRARLSKGTLITNEESTDILAKERSSLKKKRLIYSIAGSFVFILVVGWIALSYFGSARFLDPPETLISARPEKGDWPMFQRDPLHTGLSSDYSTPNDIAIKWTFKIDTPFYASPAVVGNKVYVSTGDERILALDADSGELIWEHFVTGPVNSSPAVAGDYVFAGLRDGTIIAIDKTNGTKIWEYETGSNIYSSPAVYQGVLYIGARDGTLHALDAKTGESRWIHLTRGRITSSPAVNREITAVMSQDSYLYMIDHATGKRRLDFRTSRGGTSPTFHSNLIFIADEKGAIRAIDWHKKEVPFEKGARRLRTQLYLLGLVDTLPPTKGFVWGFQEKNESFIGAPVIANELLYAGSTNSKSGEGTLFALDKSNGSIIWTFETQSSITSPISASTNSIFVGDEFGILYSVDSASGKPQWTFQADAQISSTPVLANDMIYISTMRGTLYALK